MNGLMLSTSGRTATLGDVASVETPQGHGRWQPVPHIALYEQVMRAIEHYKFNVIEESHALDKGGLRYAGLIRVKGETSEWTPVFGIMNSHDQSTSAKVTFGDLFMLCLNLCISAERLIARKHTKNIFSDLPNLVNRVIGQMPEHLQLQDARYNWYGQTEVSDKDIHDTLIRAAESKVVAPSKILKVLGEYHNPTHSEYAKDGHTVMTLHQAFTETHKGTNIFTLPKRQDALIGLLDSLSGFDPMAVVNTPDETPLDYEKIVDAEVISVSTVEPKVVRSHTEHIQQLINERPEVRDQIVYETDVDLPVYSETEVPEGRYDRAKELLETVYSN